MRTNADNHVDPLVDRDPDDPVDLNDTDYRARQARQGRTGRPVLLVLICALALALIGWAAVEYYGQQLPGNTPDNAADAPAPTTNSSQIPDNQPTTDATAGTNTQTTPTVDADQTPQSGSGGGSPAPATNNGTVQ